MAFTLAPTGLVGLNSIVPPDSTCQGEHSIKISDSSDFWAWLQSIFNFSGFLEISKSRRLKAKSNRALCLQFLCHVLDIWQACSPLGREGPRPI